MKLYVAATPDKYELPVFIADSATELARLCGTPAQYIYQACWYQRTRAKHRRKIAPKKTKYVFYMVEV